MALLRPAPWRVQVSIRGSRFSNSSCSELMVALFVLGFKLHCHCFRKSVCWKELQLVGSTGGVSPARNMWSGFFGLGGGWGGGVSFILVTTRVHRLRTSLVHPVPCRFARSRFVRWTTRLSGTHAARETEQSYGRWWRPRYRKLGSSDEKITA